MVVSVSDGDTLRVRADGRELEASAEPGFFRGLLAR
jgi:hypothetical protein